MLRVAIVPLMAAATILLASCGGRGASSSKSAASSQHVSTARARPQALLEADGIASVKFGQPPDAVAARLGRLFGPPVGAKQNPDGYRPEGCGFYWQEWRGLGAASNGRLFVVELAVQFKNSRFVGYTYGPNNFQTELNTWSQYASHPMMLATAKRLAVGDPLARGRRLYGRTFVVTTRAQGTPPNPRLERLPVWEASTSSGRIEGGIGSTRLVARADGTAVWTSSQRSIFGIGAGAGPDTPC